LARTSGCENSSRLALLSSNGDWARTSGNSGKPSSRDPAAERQRQAEERSKRSAKSAGAKRSRGKQRGAKGSGLAMSAEPDEVIEHRPER
jgi:hypothetical protein